jgi:glucokinase
MPELYAIGIDLGGSSVKSVVVDPQGRHLSDALSEFDPNTEMQWAADIRRIVATTEKERGCAATWIGLSAPGFAAPNRRSIACMPGRLAGLQGLDWTEFLGRQKAVPVFNDAHAALLGEAWLGAARGLKDVFMLTLGTGVGGAAIVEGRLLTGHIGRGGHLGHISLDPSGPPDVTGMPGSLEDAIGNWTIQARTNGQFATTHELVAAHLAGDSKATEIWLESVQKLACGIASLVNVLDPEAVIVGGGIARSGAALFKPLQGALDRIEWRPTGSGVKLLPAELGELAGGYGAAFAGINYDAKGIKVC